MSLFENKKKSYFKHKLDGVQKMIWDHEFKREKTMVIREEVRREYDGAGSKLHIVQNQITAQLKDPAKICEIHNPEEGKPKLNKEHGSCSCQFIETGFIGMDEFERLQDQKELLVNDSKRYAAQMRQMDADVNGSTATNEFPEGIEGINQVLEGLRELQGMIKLYIQTL